MPFPVTFPSDLACLNSECSFSRTASADAFIARRYGEPHGEDLLVFND
jgi:hypothetical protein